MAFTELTPVELLQAAFGRVCRRLGCTAGPVVIEYGVLSMTWLARHGHQAVSIDEDLTNERGVDHLREWFTGIHRHLEDSAALRDRWPIRAVDPLIGG